jgi:hypothetical protein
MPGSHGGLDRLPMRDAATGLAVKPAKRSVAPDIPRGGRRMALDLHGAELEVHPRPTDAAARRAIAGGGCRGS